MSSRFKIIDDAEEVLTADINATQRKVFEELKQMLRRFDTQGGKIKLTTQELNLINDAEDTIRKALNSARYNSRVNKYLKDFDRLTQEVIDEQRRVNGVDIKKRPLNAVQKSAIKQTINNLLGNGLDANLIQPVKDILLKSASAGMSIAEAELQLRLVILGDSERLGKLERYVTQIARDAISQYDGMLQSLIQKELELDGYSYEGSIIRDSRSQCRRWVDIGEIPIAELKKEIAWAYANGSGMIPGTTPDNFAIYRGGYNCRHFATAIRL